MNQINSIDLGLSVLWADRNIGAASPWDSGDYFAWGETAPKDDFSWENYKYTEVDAATAILGGGWRIPTIDDFKELVKNCDSRWDKDNKCRIFRSKINGVEIVFPAAGWKVEKRLNFGRLGFYWSSSLFLGGTGASEALSLNFNSACKFGVLAGANNLRMFGFPIRAVREKK